MMNFTVYRRTTYRCSDDNNIHFNTTWRTETHFTSETENIQLRVGAILQLCINSKCNNVKLNVNVRSRSRRNWYYAWSRWTNGNYSFLKKNCDKLYWTNWIETANCKTSTHMKFRRSCIDCDGDTLEQRYCDANSHAVIENECNHYWSEWVEGNCFTSACNLTGERLKTRQCLYSRNEVSDSALCSKNNESAIATETCTNTTLSVQCTQQNSSCHSSKTDLYIGIGVAVPLIMIIFIILALIRYYRLKIAKILLRNKTKLNTSTTCEFAKDKFENKITKDNEKNLDKTKQSEKPTSNITFKNSTVHEHEQSQNDEQQSKLSTGKLKFVARIQVSKNSQQNKIKAQNSFSTTEPNVYDVAKQDDLHVYEIASPQHQREPNFTSEKDPNLYSNLQSPNDIAECTYSKLEH